jgi:hypothetical protein
MFTHAYLNGWIHGYCDRSECKVQFADYSTRRVKSYRAAQLALRKQS